MWRSTNISATKELPPQRRKLLYNQSSSSAFALVSSRCTTSMCWPPSAGHSGLASPVFAVGPSARRWSSHSAAKFLRLCLLVALTLSATLWRYLFRRVVLPAVWSLFFLLLLLWLILCLSLLFVAPPSAHFCKLLISFFFLISFLMVCHRSQLFSHIFFP